MAAVSVLKFLVSLLASVFAISSALKCSHTTFLHKRVFKSCVDLRHLGAQLYWNYVPSHEKVSIAYRAKQVPTGWIAWGINPTRPGMIGSQALVAFHNADGRMIVYPTSIKSYDPSMLPEKLSFLVSNISAEYANNVMTIYATVGPLKNGSVVNHVWQAGSSVSGNVPQMHATFPSNLQSVGKIDFYSA
ncbi:cytochrome b561 and DOMON domain-containing protein At5g47530-like [Andrographis paniculata]|uniref:cytochrome b561 and DOMON domain-containing protein At5g47530-like n=1 Tax=Andrographis paniculata TaxID=175694 RepID=UPI0021E77924|nr:cytochrome b561 and DOMON domain-containing protein At5g47530-like [Andrographis paniculata]